MLMIEDAIGGLFTIATCSYECVELDNYWKNYDAETADDVPDKEKGSWLLWKNCIEYKPSMVGIMRAWLSEEKFVEFICSSPRKDVRRALEYLDNGDLCFKGCWNESESSVEPWDPELEGFFFNDLANKLNNIEKESLGWVDIFDMHRGAYARGRWKAIGFLSFLICQHKRSVERVNHPKRRNFDVL